MTPFPAELPSSIDDAHVIQRHDWDALRQLERMEDHWQRPDWPPGRSSYHWMLSFHAVQAVRQLATRCQSEIDMPSFDLVPLDALHLTVGRVAFTDEISAQAALAAASEARESCRHVAPFDLTIGPLAGSRGALRFSVAPWAPLLTLHRLVATATQTAVPGRRSFMDTSAFRPHLSVAYSHDTISIESILPLLERLRLLGTITVPVRSVALVKLRRQDMTYRYDIMDEVSLGAGENGRA